MPILTLRAEANEPDGAVRPVPEILQKNGTIIPVTVIVSDEVQQAMAAQGTEPPKAVTGFALIDTGATTTCFDEVAARRAGLPAVGVSGQEGCGVKTAHRRWTQRGRATRTKPTATGGDAHTGPKAPLPEPSSKAGSDTALRSDPRRTEAARPDASCERALLPGCRQESESGSGPRPSRLQCGACVHVHMGMRYAYIAGSGAGRRLPRPPTPVARYHRISSFNMASCPGRPPALSVCAPSRLREAAGP